MADSYSPTAIALKLEAFVPDGVRQGVDLSGLTRWGIGGTAEVIVEPESAEQVAAVLRLLRTEDVPYCVVGSTSNLLFDSKGINGVVLRIAERMAFTKVAGTGLTVGAGTTVPDLARRAGALGLTGIEHIVGIPGTIGGLLMMNGGTQRRGIGENVTWVKWIDENGEIHKYSQEDCRFTYRSSRFQEARGAIVEAGIKLQNGDRNEIEATMDGIIESRRERFPEHLPNCGSTFLSDPAMYETVGPPGRVIESAGFKGARRGGAEVSQQHANFINNVGNATSDDVLTLIADIRRKVHSDTGFDLRCEVRYVATNGDMIAAHMKTVR